MSNYDRPLQELLEELPLTVKSQPNLTRRATVGVTDLYTTIRNSTIYPSSRQRRCYSTADGHLNVPPTELPVMVARYKCVEHVAEGTFSNVIRAIDLQSDDNSGNRPVAIKIMHRLCSVLGLRELTILYHLQSTCRHTKLAFVPIMDAFSFQDHISLVMEYFPFTLMDLFHQPRRSRSARSGAILKQPRAIRQDILPAPARKRPAVSIAALQRLASTLVKALWLLEQQGIIHADIKPENVFLQPAGEIYAAGLVGQTPFADDVLLHGDIKLGDFGNALHTSEVADYFKDFEIQSLPYRAPEVLMRRPFDTAIDMWSLGVVLVEVYVQEPLFTASSAQQLIAAIEQKLGPIAISPSTSMPQPRSTDTPGSWRRHSKPLLSSVGCLQAVQRLLFGAPSDFITFTAGLLQADPLKRLTPASALKHPFLSGTNDLSSAPLLNPLEHSSRASYVGAQATNAYFSAEAKIEEVEESRASSPAAVYRSVVKTHIESHTIALYDHESSSSKRSPRRKAPRDLHQKGDDATNAAPPQTRPATLAAKDPLGYISNQEYDTLLLDSNSDGESELDSRQTETPTLKRYNRGNLTEPLKEEPATTSPLEASDKTASKRSRRRTAGSLPMFAQLAGLSPSAAHTGSRKS